MPPKTRQTARTKTRRNASQPTPRATRSNSPPVEARTPSTQQSTSRSLPRTHVTQPFNFPDNEEEPEVSPQMTTQPTGRLMETFSGIEPNVKVDDWLTAFEVVTSEFNDKQRFIALFKNVTGDAMTFASRELAPNRDTLSWTDIRNRIQERFGRPKHSHLLEAIDRNLKPNETIASYFDEKRRLMTLANENDKNQVDLLTRGLTNNTMKS